MLECAVTAVSDDLMPNAIGISCYSTYSHALLLGLADPCAMSVTQIELTDRWLAHVGAQGLPLRAAARDRRPGDRRRPRQPRRRGARRRSHRAAGRVDALRLPGQARDQRARAAEATADRRESRRAAARPRLQRRAMHDAARSSRCALVPGAERARATTPHMRRSSSAAAASAPRTSAIGGRTFDRKDPLGRLSFQGAQHLQTLGALTDYDRGREDAERTWVVGALGRHATSGARRRRSRGRPALSIAGRSTSSSPCATKSACASASVTRVALDAHGELALSLRLWSGAPTAIAVRPLSTACREDPPVPARFCSPRRRTTRRA